MKAFQAFFRKHLKKVIFLVVLIAAGYFVLKAFVFKASTDVEEFTPPETAEIERQDISNYISVTGNIEAVDSQTVYSTINDVEVLSVAVEVGQTVSKNQIIATLDSSEVEDKLATAQKELNVQKAKSQIKVARANEDLDRAYVDAADGEKHNAQSIDRAATDYGYTLGDAEHAYKDWQDALEDYEEAKDDYKDADQKYNRVSRAYSKLKNGDPSVTVKIHGEERTFNNTDEDKEELRGYLEEYENKRDSAEKNRDSAESAATSKERAYYHSKESSEQSYRKYDDAVEDYADKAETNQRKIEDETYSQIEANLDASIATDQQEDQIKNYKKQIDKCSIKAPIDGVVTSVKMEEGDETGNDNNVICVIQDTSAFVVNGTVDEYDVSKIHEGMKAIIKTEATGDEKMEGVVTYVAPTPKGSGTSNSSSNTQSSSSTVEYEVKIKINDLNPMARIGMTAATNIIIEEAKDVLSVPYDYVAENEKGESVIYVVDKAEINMESEETGDDKRMSGRPSFKEIVVTKGLETDYYVQIEASGISEGMTVVSPSDIQNFYSDGEDAENGSRGGFGFGGGRGGRGGRPPF